MRRRNEGNRDIRSSEEILEQYRARGLGFRVGFGSRPAVVIVDLIRGFTDPDSPLGSDLESVVGSTIRLLESARDRGLPIFFTTTAYNEDFSDGGLFIDKVPSLQTLVRGSDLTELDPRLGFGGEETLIEKQFASAFFGTTLAEQLNTIEADTLLIAGATTSGCIRATVVDALQNGFRAIVPEECVGDRAQEPHAANLLDIDGKYGDVVSLAAVLEYLEDLPDRS